MKITLQDYKPFKGKTSIDLKPVTIIIGKNNAGKTSLTNFINLQINSANDMESKKFFSRLKTSSISQLVNYHKWKYIPEDIYEFLSDFNKKDLKPIIGTIDSSFSTAQLGIIQRFIGNDVKYYDNKRDIALARRDFQIKKSSKKPSKAILKEREYMLDKAEYLNKKREDIFFAFQKLCSYDPNIFYEFIHSQEFLEQRMLHSMSIAINGAPSISKFESIPREYFNLKTLEKNDKNIIIKDKKEFAADLKKFKYLNNNDSLRLHTIMDSLTPYYSTGLGLNYELSYSLLDYEGVSGQKWQALSYKNFEGIIERMYNGYKLSSNKSQKLKRSFKTSYMNKKYGKFFQSVFEIFNSRDKMFKNNSSLPIEMHVNINDEETNTFYKSTNRLFNGLRIDASNERRVPAKLYFESESEMYQMNKSIVKNLLKKTAPHFYELIANDLDAIFHTHNRFYYNNPVKRFFKAPRGEVYRSFLREENNIKKIKNPFHASIDNLPYKCFDIINNPKETKKFPFKELPIISLDKFINGIFIQHSSGHQNFQQELVRGNRVYVHDRIKSYKNDVECISSFNEIDPSRFFDKRFHFDISSNKVFFKSQLQNPFSSPDLLSSPPAGLIEENEHGNASFRERNINKIISLLVDIAEADREWSNPKLCHERYDKRTIKSRNFLQEREKFAIGGALASSVSKIFEILFEDFIENYAFPVLSSSNIVKRDGDGRRVQRRLSSTIIDSSNLPAASKKQYFNINELNLIFHKDLESIISSKSNMKRLIARVNNALNEVDIKYAIQIDSISPTTGGRVVGETLYTITLKELNSKNKIVHLTDFSMVGEGIRSIIALLMQIEIHILTKGQFPCYLTIREFENHLHPSLVGRFFKFLIDKTLNTNINLIIETHSEIILRTLQTVVKNSADNIDSSSLEPKRVGIYYIEKNDSGDSDIKKLILDKSGYFDDKKGSKLPPDFFDINSKLSRELLED